MRATARGSPFRLRPTPEPDALIVRRGIEATRAGAEATAGHRGLQRYRLAMAVMWKQLSAEMGFETIPSGRLALASKKRLRREISAA